MKVELKPAGRCLGYGCACQAFKPYGTFGGWPYCRCNHAQQTHAEEATTDATGAVMATPDPDA